MNDLESSDINPIGYKIEYFTNNGIWDCKSKLPYVEFISIQLEVVNITYN
jgi:hypothetical protein